MGIEKRRHVRVAGPFDGYRLGLLDTPVRIYDLSEGGCFITSPHASPASGRHLVLKAVLSVLVKALLDYRVLAARNVSEAWTLGRSARLDLLITDYLMPDGTGEELITKLCHTHPSLKTLMLTGHQNMLDDEGFGWWKYVRHLPKPCSLDDLRAAVTALIGSP